MKKELIIIRFSSGKRFFRFCEEIRSGRVFIPTPKPIPPVSRILLKLIIPSNQEVFLIEGDVAEGRPDPGSPGGMVVAIDKDIKAVLSEMDKAITGRRSGHKPLPPGLPEDKIPPAEPENAGEKVAIDVIPGGGKNRLSFETVRDIVSRDEMDVSPEQEAEAPDETIFQERKLTPEERQKAQPVAEFIMNLTKAMSRSGYYDPGHPGSKKAKEGLLDEFVRVAGDCSEVAFSIRRGRKHEDVDIMITGILDEQVSARNLVGPGVAELFVPKLNDYFDRKELLSFAVKKEITPEHFDRFIDIMSDPKVDHKEFEKKGEHLTNALIESGISEISAIFTDDMIALETELPWRVEMAINRLAKDLKTLPMFRGFSSDAVRKLKFQTVQDIIRPLNHPRYLNDFLTNCYIIAKNVEGMKAEEIEGIIVDAFPVEQLLPTSRFTFKELEHLKQLKAKQPESKGVVRRLLGIKRILKLISSRVILGKAPGAYKFLEGLYKNEILVFEELPAEVQHVINTGRMADDIKKSFSDYAGRVLSIKSSEEALVYLKCFRRTVPIFVEQGDWELLAKIAALIEEASGLPSMRTAQVMDEVKVKILEKIKAYAHLVDSESNDPSGLLCAYVFIGVLDELVRVYAYIDQDRRSAFEEFIESIGLFGVDVISRVLSESEDKESRKRCFDSLVKKGEHARKWALQVLSDKKWEWYVYRNSMMILRHVSRRQVDFEAVRRFIKHDNSRLRDEALSVAAALRPLDFEELIIKALFDSDAKIRWRAVKLLGEISPISEDAMDYILKMIAAPIPEEKEEGAEQMKSLTTLISAINVMPEIPNTMRVEEEILRALRGVVDRGRGIVKLIKRVAGSEDESGVLKIAIPLLGRIGGSPSVNFLKKLNRSHPRHSELIKNAMHRIKQRLEKR